jgi:hypothetical protein
MRFRSIWVTPFRIPAGEKAVAAYCAALDSDSGLQANFAKMFGDYGSIYID